MEEKPKYEFKAISEQIAATLLKAAEDQVTEANNLLASTKVLAEGIEAQVVEQTRLIENVSSRLRSFGESILEAHKKYLDVPVGKETKV